MLYRPQQIIPKPSKIAIRRTERFVGQQRCEEFVGQIARRISFAHFATDERNHRRVISRA